MSRISGRARRGAAAFLLGAFIGASMHGALPAASPDVSRAELTPAAGRDRKSDDRQDKAMVARKSVSPETAAGCKRPQPVPGRRPLLASELLPAPTPASAGSARAERTGPTYLLSFLPGTSHSRRDPPV